MSKYFEVIATCPDGELWHRWCKVKDKDTNDDVINNLMVCGWAERGDIISIIEE